MNALSTFKSEPTTFYLNKEPYTLKNYNDKYENKKITMGYAIATSDNIYSVKTHLYLGSDKLIKFLKLFDISIKEDYPSLALGTVSMTLEKLTEIYNTFSRLGKYSKSYTINKIHANNKEYYIKRKKVKQKLNENTTFILNELLTNTFDTNLNSNINVTGNSIAHKINTKTAAKTGLTDYDSYIIGFTPKYTIGIWTGNSDNSLLTDLYSKQFPKQCFYNIVNQLSVENKNIWYDRPNGVYNIFTDPTGFNTGYKKNVYFLN
jgi:membrane peptidoglycan carboxypeptidase